MGSSYPYAALARAGVVVGFLLRAWHYAVNHTIWYDESVLLANVMGKGFGRLLGPLDNAVAAPPLFLWLLKSVNVIFGDEPYAWRFVPFAFGVGTLLLTGPLVRRVLSPLTAAVAVWLVAVSDNHVWLGCTVKPYAGDSFVTTLLLFGFVSTTHWPTAKRLWLLAAVTPFALCISYPSAFVIGGLLAATLRPAIREARLAWLTAATAAAGTFAALYFGPVQEQRVPGLVAEWARDFPNWEKPLSVPGWAAEHTATVFQYAYLPTGVVLVALAAVGVVVAWRNGRRALVVAAVVPFLLVLAAAGAKAYPYGFNRLMHFAAPLALVLGGLGMSAINDRIRRSWAIGLGAVLVLATAAPVAIHTVRPWPKPDAQSTAAFVKKHWQPGDAVFSDEGNYLYFFHGELKPLAAAKTCVPPGGRAWAVMDFYTADHRRLYVNDRLAPAGLVCVGEWPFRDATAFLYERR